jgi:hypothetical protein
MQDRIYGFAYYCSYYYPGDYGRDRGAHKP